MKSIRLPWNPEGQRLFWWGAALPAVLLGIIYSNGIAYMVHKWYADENYGHGFFVPLISLYLIWQQRHRLREKKLQGSWWGVPVLLIGVGLYFIGELATIYVVVHLSLWVVLIGLTLAAIGGEGMRIIAFPLFYLLAMIPLPDFLYQGLSGWLQLVSSALGVGCLQVIGVTAFREGNVIDLGPIQLQVVEACSGLRYLFPLAALALICAYLFREKLWKRVLLFLSSFPIAIFLNGFRIGMTGLLVDLYGIQTAEGFFHSFSGWLLFVSSLSILFAEMWLLARIDAGKRKDFREWFGAGLDPVGAPRLSATASLQTALRPPPSTYLFSVALLVPVLFVSMQINAREEIVPSRESFTEFPMQVAAWSGKPLVMEEAYRNALRFDDYLLADYQSPERAPINLYVAYYGSQKKGQSAHSPRTCIPGGGWEITSLRTIRIDAEGAAIPPLWANRVLIQKGDQKQLVYYWFQQRGRILTNEYLVKFYLLWDAVTLNRTDGALVRLTAAISPGESESSVDDRLVGFARTVRPHLGRYIPDHIQPEDDFSPSPIVRTANGD
ncbi:MAG: VPLPA-CTERM-specific exosortase XrtD [Candidatus Manganitrophus sp.]|nr:VPLPA-CTERM-specific exosortase XrtD [Candidatus Manganitrophus sp.]MDC4226712.1 VPLPA-CTERM-specific exosortase XrtD [Candidatus Manganitrophus sp.]WDT72132.1 MAG: VPLPA-CTERM-specific exosortase XrtD [Candidatus Manganitrophus sp.]